MLFSRIPPWLANVLEPLAIVALCFLFAGSPPPAVNEAHYLAKAKHYWQPDWCASDFFLESADAHEVFFWAFGWVTQYLTLPAAAWTGRLLVWWLFAITWCRMLRALSRQRGAGLLSVLLLLPLTYYGHLAGEWLIGGIEAKGFAYPLVFLALAQAIEGKWWLVWPLLGLASSFHILVGGWAVVACLFAWLQVRHEDNLDFKELAVWLAIGGVLSLPGLLPALQLSAGATAEEIREANITYTFRRLSHHLVPYRFAQWNPWAPGFTVLRPASFALACFIWWKLKDSVTGPRWRRLQHIVHASLCIALAGLAVDTISSPFDHFQIPPFHNLRASLMRYYWFRMSDMMIPVGLAIVLVLRMRDPTVRHWQSGVVVALALAGFASSSAQYGFAGKSMSLEQQNWARIAPEENAGRMDEDWLDICRWFRDKSPADSIVLTPVQQQTFKWFAHRAEVVTWKDVPQNAVSIAAWWQRRRAVYKLGDWPWNEPEQLQIVLSEYDVTHIAWPNRENRTPGTNARLVYRNESFAVFTVNAASDRSITNSP